MLLATVVIAVLAAACTAGLVGTSDQPATSAPAATLQSGTDRTGTPSPDVLGPPPSSPITAATTPAATPWPPPVATLPASPNATSDSADIPGLTRAIVRLDLQTRGFTCADQRTIDGEIWDECRLATADGARIVVLRGLATIAIRVIDVTALGEGGPPSGADLALLEAMAGVPCTGCERGAAREWVRRTAAVGGEATIGSLDLQLYGDAETRVLQVRAAAGQPPMALESPPESPAGAPSGG